MSTRRLPHEYPQGRWLFVTFQLHGSLPQGVYPPPDKLSAGQAFAWMDRRLDTASDGPMFLKQEAIANLVIESLFRGVELGQYQLGPFVLMANHVHVLLLPLVAPSKLLRSLKGYTAHEANRLLNRTGAPFWQHESYDHWVRDETEWNRIAAYIENNPVKAGLVSKPDEYRWSSAHKNWSTRAGTSAGSASTSACATTATATDGSNQGSSTGQSPI